MKSALSVSYAHPIAQPQPSNLDGFVRCSAPDCDIVVGNERFGAKKPRLCCKCQALNKKRIDRATQERKRGK